MTFYEQWGEPAAGLALAREGIEIGRRLGSRAYGFQMVGNGSICALRIGEWDWAAALLDEWLAIDTVVTPAGRVLRRPGDPAHAAGRGRHAPTSRRRPDSASAAASPTRSSSRTSSGRRAWAAFVEGRYDEAAPARDARRRADELLRPARLPARHPERAVRGRRLRRGGDAGALDASGYRGPALSADRLVATAGIDALEGRGASAVAGYREALRAYRQLGLAFDEAAAVVDMATLLPADERDAPDIVAAIAAARETLERLGARPFLERLDRARPKEPAGRP